ncbi:MAG: DUF1993 domain-containing protein [Pseudomonadota bacterium]
MTTSLYDLSVGSYLQSLAGVSQVLAAGREFAEHGDLSLEDIMHVRLRDDMLPFWFQVLAVEHQSLDAIDGIKTASFGPPANAKPMSYDAAETLVTDTIKRLEAVDADDLNSYAGKPVVFRMGEMEIPFTSENFVLSFSLPNLYFHATTLYDILRMQGVPLSKRHFLGPMRMGA